MNLTTYEKAARKMYEADNADGLPWVYRGWDVRQAWLNKAQQRHESAITANDGHRIWPKMKSLFWV